MEDPERVIAKFVLEKYAGNGVNTPDKYSIKIASNTFFYYSPNSYIEDSFTFNLAHLLGAYDTVQVSNFYEINKSQLKKADMIVLSPGPGEPKNYPKTTKINHEYKGKKKILGICLGFQQILFAEGGQIVQQKNIYHGYQSTINVLPKSYLYKHYKFKQMYFRFCI